MMNEREALKVLIEDEEKIINFYVRYEDDIKQLTSKDEWEIEVNECLDNLSNLYKRLNKMML